MTGKEGVRFKTKSVMAREHCCNQTKLDARIKMPVRPEKQQQNTAVLQQNVHAESNIDKCNLMLKCTDNNHIVCDMLSGNCSTDIPIRQIIKTEIKVPE